MASRNVDGEIIVGINQPESLRVMNEDLKKILSQMNNLEAVISHAKLDKTAAEELLKQIRDLKAEINVSNVKINQTQVTSDVQQTGQKMGKQMGDNINQGLSQSLRDVKYTIADMLKNFPKLNSFNLSSIFNLNRKDIDSSVTMQVREITKEIETLSAQVLKTNSDSSWEGVIDKIASLRSILNQFGQIRDTSSFKESIDLLDYFNNKKIYVGNKDEVLKNTGRTLKELNNEFMNLVKFTTSAKGSIKLDTVWDELSRISPGLEKFTAFGDMIKALVDQFKIAKQAMYGNSGLVSASETNEVSNVLMKYMDILENAAKKLSVLREEQAGIEQMIANGSTSAADKIVQNEQKKQEAYKQTAEAQKQIAKDESLIKSGANVGTFNNTNNAAREASQHFKELLKDENALIAVTERFNKANELNSFVVNIKRASGEVETLRYALENVGSITDPFYVFKNIGAEINNSGAVKQMQQMEKVITDYQTKLENLKTKYSKTSLDYSGFETVFNNFKNGIGTVNDLKIAFNQLENSAKMGIQSLKSQKSSLDPIQQAINNLRDFPVTLKALETNMSGLQDKTALAAISISDLSAQYTKLRNELDLAGGKIPLTDTSWVKDYQKLMAEVTTATKRVATEQAKAEKSTNSFFASFKNGFSFFSYWLSPMYLMMQVIAKVKQAFTELKSVNSIMTEISKVTEMTTAQLKKLGNEAYSAASKYGRTISDYLTGVQEMSRAGFQENQAKEMAELSVLAQAAGDISAELSNEYLIATNAAYKLNGEVSRLNDVLDGQNYVANRNAVSMEHLANATKVVASQAASSGVAVNEMTAAVGTMVATTQQSGDVAGRAFKAILMNLQQVSGELDDGEIIDEESLTKYEKACNDLGVSLKTVKDGVVSLREPMEILKELAEAYTSLDKMDARRANLITAIGGKQRGNQLNALLENWGTYEKMLTDYSQGAGSAMNEAMKSANNWEGSLNRLHNTWVNTVENIANSDAIIKIINGSNSLLDVLNKLTSKLGSVGTIGVGAFAITNLGRSNDFAL